MTIAVLGATGGQGGAVVTALREAGRPVRAMVRDPASARARALADAGVEVIRGELSDSESIAAVFRGADAAFAVTTPFGDGLAAEKAQGMAIVEAATSTDLPHLVMASVASAGDDTGIPHFRTKAHTEQFLAASGAPATVVAPTYFYDNALGALPEIAAGTMTLALPAGTPLQQVALRDLGRLVAAVVAHPGHWIGRRVEVAGDAPTPAQMASAIGRAAGHEVAFQELPLEKVREENADMGAMFGYLAESGYHVDIPDLRADFPDLGWLSFADWAAGQRWSPSHA